MPSSSAPPPPPPLLPTLPRFTSYTSISQWLDALFVQYRDKLPCPKCGQRGSLYKNWSSAPRLPSGQRSPDARHRRYDHKGCLDKRAFSLSCADFVQYVLSPFLEKAAAATTMSGSQGAGSTSVQRETAATLLKGCKLALEALAKHGNHVNEQFSRRIGEVRRDQSQLMAALQGGLLVPDDESRAGDENEQDEDGALGDFNEMEQVLDFDFGPRMDGASCHDGLSSDEMPEPEDVVSMLASLDPPQAEASFCIAIPAQRKPRAQARRHRRQQPQRTRHTGEHTSRKGASNASLRPQRRKEYVEDPEPVPTRRRRKSRSTASAKPKSLLVSRPSHYFSNTHGGPGLPKNRRPGVIIRAARQPPPPAEPLPILSPEDQVRQLRAALSQTIEGAEGEGALTVSYLNVRSLNAEKWQTIFTAFQQAVDSTGPQHIMILAETWRPRHLMLDNLLAHHGNDDVEEAACAWIAASTVPTPSATEATPGSLPRCNGGLLLLCPPSLRNRLVVLSITPYSLTFSLALPSTGPSASRRPLIIHSVYLPPSMGRISSFPLLSAFASPPDSLRADVLLGDMNVYYEPQAPLLTGEEDPDRVEEEAEIVVTGYPRARLAVIEEVTRRLGLQRVVGVGEEGDMRYRRLNRKGLRLRRRERGEEVIRGVRPVGAGQDEGGDSEDDDDSDEGLSTSASAAIPALSRNDHAFVRPAADDEHEETATSPFSSRTVSFWRAGIRTDHPLMRLDLALRS